MKTLQKFIKHINDNRLINSKGHLLLAVSGGKDSMCMLYLMQTAGFKISVAHFNFKLRDKESDEDENFVRKFCVDRNIIFHGVSGNTKHYAEQNNISIQMAAREMRYEWFNNLVNEFNYDAICTAHHADDNAETILLNLIRGKGLLSLQGIPVRNNNIIRPMLCFTRNDIHKIISENNIPFCEDSSNQSDDYSRNYLRHKIIPLINEINPSSTETINVNGKLFSGIDLLAREYAASILKNAAIYEAENIILDISLLKQNPAFATLLYYFLEPYGFGKIMIADIISASGTQSGKKFFSQTHVLFTAENKFILQPVRGFQHNGTFIIESTGTFNTGILVVEVENIPRGNIEFSSDQNIAFVDKQKIKFPLSIRKWKNGDYFYPLGMNGKQKISDFLINNKIPLPYKEDIMVLESQDEIVWVIGQRLDHRYRITENTSEVLSVKIKL